MTDVPPDEPGWGAPAPAPAPPPPPPPPPPVPGPSAPPPGPPPFAQVAAPIWRSIHGLGVALQVQLWVVAVAWIAHGGALAYQRSLAADAFESFSLSALRDLENADDAVAGTGTIALLLAIAVFVCIVVWLWRASKNLEVLGRFNPSLGPGWAIGGWFIPVGNAVLPAIVLHDAWRGSDPTIAAGDPRWKSARTSGLFWVWWLTFVAGVVLLNVGGGFTNEAGEYETYDDFRSGNAVELASSASLAVAAGCGALFVRALTSRQDLWGRHLGYQRSAGPPPTSGAAAYPVGEAPPPPPSL